MITQSRANELLQHFAKHRILVVGDVVLDHYVSGVVERINPEAPVPILRTTMEREETGGAGNVAKNVAALGPQTVLVSVVGDDAVAERIEQAAAREGYRAVLTKDSSRPSIRKVRYLAGSQQLLRVDHERVHDIGGTVEEEVIAAIHREIDKGIDAIIVSDYAKGTITKRVAHALLDAAGQRNILVAADVKPSRAAYFVGASLVSPNVKEAYEYLGFNHLEHRLPPHELARLVYTKLCADVYLTMGKDGMFVYCGGERGTHVPQDNVVEVADTSGAGDTSVSVLLLSLLSGASEVEASYLANAGGAVVVSRVGCVGISIHDLNDMLARRAKQQAVSAPISSTEPTSS